MRFPRVIEQRVDVRQRLDCRARDGVEAAIVVADAPQPLWLACEHFRCRVANRRVLDRAAIELVDELRAQLRDLTVEHGYIGRDRGIGGSAGSGRVASLMQGSCGCGAAYLAEPNLERLRTGPVGLQRRKCWVVCAAERPPDRKARGGFPDLRQSS